jgi:GntR family transcriptional regulator / MocR family aminotransferase
MIVLDTEAADPLYMQIYRQLKEQILSGRLPEGSKLPSTRGLAGALHVSRNTVESAYAQLFSEGYVAGRRGSGFVVEGTETYDFAKSEPIAAVPQPDADSHRLPPGTGFGEEGVGLMPPVPVSVDFRYGALDPAYFPMRQWRRLTTKCLAAADGDNMVEYSDGKGDLSLRTAIMRHIAKTRGVVCEPGQIMVSAGIHHSLSLLCQLLRGHISGIGMEDPGFIWANQVFANHGFDVQPIGLDKDGIRLDEVEESGVNAVYVTPSHQFPMGAVMPIQRRLQLLQWAKHKDGIIIEDDYDSELRYNSKPIPSIQSIDKAGTVVYIGTFSKSLSPSLRVNYMVLPRRWMEVYDRQFSWYQSPVALLQQHTLRAFLAEGHWERHLRMVNHSGKRKHDLLLRSLQDTLGSRFLVHGKNAGLHIVLESVAGHTEGELVRSAAEQGVNVWPLSAFWSRRERYSGNMVLLGFGAVDEAAIADGVHRLGTAWQ